MDLYSRYAQPNLGDFLPDGCLVDRRSLEGTWGTFRLNAYYFLGMFFCVASALIFGASGGNMFLNLSLFLAVATLAPNMEILFLLVIPLKLKWVALISLLWPAYILVTGSLPVKMIVIMCLGNYLIFFGRR